MEARIRVLSNLYAELMPSFKTARYESLEGAGARKQTKNIDVQESISPFDLECFEDIMPSLEDFGLLPEEDFGGKPANVIRGSKRLQRFRRLIQE